ncbi:innexin inx2-like [Pollicipes pollicipes]|uniref:innexin inx2-like n=1 Tax=Pollicipes pollicipes TaxID=41117 RepID=UPI001885545C|nr:innexin inx2-like [Pollicipes pollicipes]
MGPLGDIAKLMRGKGPGSVKIDSTVFQLHYMLTTRLFWGFSILVTAYSMIGNPVSCACSQCGSESVPLDAMNTYCWVTATYTVTKDSKNRFNADGGIGPHTADDRNYQTYYQWVPFTLALHGVLFYVPHWLWKMAEGGRIATMTQDMRLPVLDHGVLKARVRTLAVYLRQTLGSHQSYFVRFVVCDALNVANVVSAIFLIDRFLNGKFLDFGIISVRYLRHAGEEVSPFTSTFPKLTKCEMRPYGTSGSRQTIDALCVLALNVLNEKVYLVLWFWLIILSVLTVVAFVGRVLLMLIRGVRVPMLESKARSKFSPDIRKSVNALEIGDFFLLSLMARNMDASGFRLLLKELANGDCPNGLLENEDQGPLDEEGPMKLTKTSRNRMKECDD